MISLIKKKGINPQTRTTLYYPQWTRVSTTTKSTLAKIMARGSTFSTGEVEGIMTDFSQFICDELLSGNAVDIKGLGTFKLSVSGKAKEDVKEVTAQGALISVLFSPDLELTQRLNTEREFQFISKPTKEGEQDVEDNDTGSTGTPGTGGDGEMEG